MSLARDLILVKVDYAKGDDDLPVNLDEAFAHLVANSSARIGHQSLRSFADNVAEFDERATEVNAEIIYCSADTDIASTLQSLIGGESIYAVDEAKTWVEGLNVSDASRGNAQFAVIGAEAGIAETGTVAVNSRISRSDALYLFDHLVLVVKASNIVARFEDYWQRFRSASEFTRAIHMISGPSRTADVEQIIQLGAHGPRRLTVIIVGHTK
jgi:L-lactate utilization protein LutC